MSCCESSDFFFFFPDDQSCSECWGLKADFQKHNTSFPVDSPLLASEPPRAVGGSLISGVEGVDPNPRRPVPAFCFLHLPLLLAAGQPPDRPFSLTGGAGAEVLSAGERSQARQKQRAVTVTNSNHNKRLLCSLTAPSHQHLPLNQHLFVSL